MGVTTVISTDHVRHMLRGFVSRQESPVLWSSTYHAGESILFPPDVSYKDQILRGWEAQNNLLFEKLACIISSVGQRECMIVEGVHLSTEVICRLMSRHKNCLPFVVYISNETKHRERFAIRAKYMTIDPRQNKYVKYINNIRTISDALCQSADKHLIPKVDNTNIDRSLAAMHSIIFSCVRRLLLKQDQVWEDSTQKCLSIHEEFVKQAFHSSAKMLRYLELKSAQQAHKMPADMDVAIDPASGSDSGDSSYDGGSIGS